jgi:hypothetical protein
MSPSLDMLDRPNSPDLGSTSASVPLLSDIEEIASDEGGNISEAPNGEKSFSTADYKIAVSHFLVRRRQSTFRSMLTYDRGSSRIQPGLISWFSLLRRLLPYSPGSRSLL